MCDTKIAIIVRKDLATWQTQNVTAFLTSGFLENDAGFIGKPYRGSDGKPIGL